MSTPSAAGLAGSDTAALALRVPASAFAFPLGIAGLAAAWRGAARAYAVSPWLSDALLVLAAALLLAVLAAQVVKALVARERLAAELRHPVRGSLAALGPGSLLAVAALAAAHYHQLSLVLFYVGAVAQVAHCVWIVGCWLSGPIEPKLVTPALHLAPVVGSLLAATAAGILGRTDAGWLFFGAGALSWIVLAAVLLVRYLSEGELAPELRPLLGVELAPPALGLAALQALQGGQPDALSRALLGYALLVALVLLRLAGRLRDAPFTLAWWGFTFPVAALASATLRMASAAPDSVAGALALPVFVVANAVVAVIAYRTVLALSRGTALESP